MELGQMELTNKHIIEPSYPGRERYFPIDANGVCGFSGWTQRPAAERHTGGEGGKGLWDNREKRILTQPNVTKRLKRLGDQVERLRKQADELVDLMDEIAEFDAAIDAGDDLRALSIDRTRAGMLRITNAY